jgi:hypothetical protein
MTSSKMRNVQEFSRNLIKGILRQGSIQMWASLFPFYCVGNAFNSLPAIKVEAEQSRIFG